MSKNKGFSRVMALVLLICMVVSFAPAAYADVDEAPAVQEESLVDGNKIAIGGDKVVIGGDVDINAPIGIDKGKTIFIAAPKCNNPDCDATIEVKKDGKVIATLDKDSANYETLTTQQHPITVKAIPGTECGCEFVKWTKGSAQCSNKAEYEIKYSTSIALNSVFTAYFNRAEVTTFTVTYSDGVNGAAFKSQTYTVNEDAATPAFQGTPAREGYKFLGWEPAVAATVTANVTYVAQWEEVEKYTVTYTDGVDGKVFPDQVYTVSSGAATPAFVGTPEREGYNFLGWEPAVAATVTANVTYVAKWREKVMTVTYTDGVDGEEIFHDQVYTVEPDSATPAFDGTPERVGYNFLGWEPAVAETVTESVTYTAKWEQIKYTITFNGNGTNKLSGTISGNHISRTKYAAGTAVNLRTAMDGKSFTKDLSADYSTNYRQIGWNTKKDGSGEHYAMNATFTMPASNVTLYAEWEAYEWRHWVATVGEGGESITIHEGVTASVEKTGTSFKLYTGNIGTGAGKVPAALYTPVEANAKDGYYCIGWYDVAKNALVSEKSALYMQDFRNLRALKSLDESGSLLEARFAKYITVTYTDGVDGEEVFADQVYNTLKPGDATPAFVGTPEREGYVFKGWAPEVAETVTEDVTYVAQWTALYTVTYTDGVDGEVLFPDQSTTVEDGSKTPAFAATPERKGYTFAGWQPAVAETVTGNVTYVAQWTANEYVLTRDSNGGDKLDNVNVTYDAAYGDAIVSSPRAGYTEDGWFLIVDKELTNTEVTAESIVNLASDHGIFLKRSIAPVTVTVSEDITKDYDGEEIVLTASTEEYTGLRYAYQWYKDGEVLAGKNDKTLTLDGNVADSGVYTVKLTVTNAQDSGVITENDAVSTEAEVKVVVNKVNNYLTYNYNGADEEDSTVETIESAITVDADKEITRKGYDFLGWNTKADGTGDSYKSGDELTFVDNGNGGEAVTLYAQWKGKEYKLTFKIKEDPDFKEDVKLNFTSKTVVYGEKVGQFPYATRKDHILVWYDKDGKRVNSETVYLVEGDSTYTGVWTEYKPVVATGDSSNIALYAAAMFASIACIGAGVILLRRKREE